MNKIIGNINLIDNCVTPIWFDNINECIKYISDKPKSNYLYFFLIDKEYEKIGFTDQIIKRLKVHHRKLGNRIGKIGIIGNIKLAYYIEMIIHSNLYYMSNSFNTSLNIIPTVSIYDSETYKIPNNISFENFIEMILIVIKQVYQNNFNNILGESEEYGFNIFFPDDNNKGLNKFLLKYYI